MADGGKWGLLDRIYLGLIALGWFFTVVLSLFDPSPCPSVSRAKADMRTVATALEGYYVDAQTYPPDVGGAILN